MILTCPACGTRYQADDAKFPPDGRMVRCAKCSHVWHQQGPLAAPEPDVAVITPEPQPQRTPEPQTGTGADEEPVFSRIGAFAPRGEAAPAIEREPIAWGALLGVAAGWIALIAVVLVIGYSAVKYRQEIAMIWPQSAGVYSSLGLKVNNRGIDFAHVDYHRESEDGQVVLAVTGTIVNDGDRELPVPQSVRVTLSDAANHELYHWNFTPNVQTLKPGQSAAFLTRLSSPPAAASHLEVRFSPNG
ncbi:MAG TPA: DUF3426 domain-containing protein [Rhizomicrobium sp.]|nr:DUF3426 domain-containing protein [Rhizomicrobium sp.]